MPARFALCLVLASGLFIVSGCRRDAKSAGGPTDKVELRFKHTPPRVGEADVLVKLTGVSGSPLTGAQVGLEGNMNHAGMAPVFSRLKEAEPGTYRGTLNFSMGGDWFVVVTAKTSDGRMLERKFDVPGVASP